MGFQIIFVCICLIAAAAVNAIPLNVFQQSDATDYANGCKLQIASHLGKPQPLYLRSDNVQFLMPQTSTGTIQLGVNKTINVHCPSGFQGKFDSYKGKTIAAACISGIDFWAANQSVRFDELRCLRVPPHQPKRTMKSCRNGKIVEVGFDTETQFLRLYTVCHNEAEGVTRWVQYSQNAENGAHQHGIDRVKFSRGDFYKGLDVDRLYQRDNQSRNLATILGSTKLANDLVKPTGDLFLARGHLAAKSDFVYANHQMATFYFINAAPQWQTFNGGNWAVLEEHLKRYVARKNINTEIWTGTYGIVTYKDVKGADQKIYLSVENNTRKIPVPKIYYKVVIDVKRKAGIAFVGINNPYATMGDIKQNYTYCQDVMDKVNYIPWKKNLQGGHMYACAVDEFAKAIGDLPSLPPTNKLLL